MSDEKVLSFEDFLKDVDPRYQEFAKKTHDYLLGSGCKLKLQLAKSGYVVSYSHKKNKKALLNFVFRKSGLSTRIYGDYASQELIESLPDKMIKSMEKSPACKLCNSRCMKGYTFTLKGAEHLKCRYNCFMFAVDDESIPFISLLIENEVKARDKA